MSRKGNCFYNAVIENFFGTLKSGVSAPRNAHQKRVCINTFATTTTSASSSDCKGSARTNIG